MAIITPKITLNTMMLGCILPKAYIVARRTTGFIIGLDSMNDIATFMGTPFLIKRLDTGITPQSHAGMKKPSNTPTTEPITGFLGIIFAKKSSLTKIEMHDESITPNSTKGVASSKIEINISDMS
jgi:hypothetical protein